MNDLSPATGKLLALSMLSGIGPATLRKLAAIPSFETADRTTMVRLLPHVERMLDDDLAWSRALEQAEQQADLAEQYNASILSPLDATYPKLLAATKDDPFLIFVRGQLPSEPEKSVAIIGTREPTVHGQKIATRITQFFVERNWSVVSGLALGCDVVAHKATLSAGGHTVAVLAHGLQTVAPTKHRQVAEEILNKGGALITEYAFGKEPLPQQFVKRDRTQAGLAQGVVMVQSDLKGGSLHASRAALDYGRWLAVPYPTDDDRSKMEPKIQANLLIAEGGVDEQMQLLRCSRQALDKIIILRGREDYAKLTASHTVVESLVPPSQGALL